MRHVLDLSWRKIFQPNQSPSGTNGVRNVELVSNPVAEALNVLYDLKRHVHHQNVQENVDQRPRAANLHVNAWYLDQAHELVLLTTTAEG